MIALQSWVTYRSVVRIPIWMCVGGRGLVVEKECSVKHDFGTQSKLRDTVPNRTSCVVRVSVTATGKERMTCTMFWKNKFWGLLLAHR